MTLGIIRIGTAGWSIPRHCAEAFTGDGTHLQRYGQVLPATEINSSFYRSHRPGTYARWAESVPPGFRFSVKLPREITHRRKLVDFAAPLERFLGEIAALGDRLGPVLVQLPPSLACEVAIAHAFLEGLRARFEGDIVFEPRHPSWFTATLESALAALRIGRVAADPPPVPEAAEPGGWPGLAYWRLHGSPRVYYSDYPPGELDAVAARMRAAAKRGAEVWGILDNTASGAACDDALSLWQRVGQASQRRRKRAMSSA
jgi:uncharacterized protein YecE (DUF72 family)